MAKHNSSIKTRYVWMTEADWRRFADALAESFPQVRYYADPDVKQRQSPDQLEIHFKRHLLEVESIQSGGAVVGVYDEGWWPDLRRRENWVRPGTSEWYIANNEKYPSFMVDMRHFYSPEQLTNENFMRHNAIFFYRKPGNKEHDLLSRTFYRTLGKFVTNRNQVQFELPSRHVTHRQEKGSLFWLGHDAIRWAKEGPDRAFLYNAQDWGFRPAD